MKPARVASVVLTAVIAGVVGWLVLRAWLDSGHEPLPLPWTAFAGTLGLAVAVIAAAGCRCGAGSRAVATTRSTRWCAARTVVLATAAAYGGAVLAGGTPREAVRSCPTWVGARRTRLRWPASPSSRPAPFRWPEWWCSAGAGCPRRRGPRRATATTRRDEPEILARPLAIWGIQRLTFAA